MADRHVTELFQKLRQTVTNTLENLKSERFSLKAFDQIFDLSQSVPMTSAEYRAMMRRAHGAMEYCLEAEFGAATFDLRMLLKVVDRLMKAHAVMVESTHVVTRRLASTISESHPPVLGA